MHLPGLNRYRKSSSRDKSTGKARPNTKYRKVVLRLEVLEDRTVPAISPLSSSLSSISGGVQDVVNLQGTGNHFIDNGDNQSSDSQTSSTRTLTVNSSKSFEKYHNYQVDLVINESASVTSQFTSEREGTVSGNLSYYISLESDYPGYDNIYLVDYDGGSNMVFYYRFTSDTPGRIVIDSSNPNVIITGGGEFGSGTRQIWMSYSAPHSYYGTPDPGENISSSSSFNVHWRIISDDQPDLAAQSLQWQDASAGGGVKFNYSIANAALTQPATVSFIWANSPNGTTGPQAAPSQTTKTQVGPDTITIPGASLTTPPQDKQYYLVARIDPANAISESNEGNNVASLEIPDIKANELKWNVDRGSDYSPPSRGVDFLVELVNSSTPINMPIGFYWSSTQAFDPSTATFIEAISVSASPGSLYSNDDARGWVTPPFGTMYLLLVLDPDNKVLETNENNNVFALRAHSAEELLKNAVVPEHGVKRGTMEATFKPGSGIKEALTLSEAEVVLGVDHFNWRQQVTSTPDSSSVRWVPATLLNVNYSRRPFIDQKPDGQLYYTNDPIGDIETTLLTPVRSNQPETWLYDPIVLGTGMMAPESASRTYAIITPELSYWNHWWNSSDPNSSDNEDARKPFPDSLPYYLNETRTSKSWDVQTASDPYFLDFYDLPEQEIRKIPDGKGGTKPVMPFGPGDSIRFETRLVGVLEDNSQYLMWGSDQGEGKGWKTNFTWGSNAVFDTGDSFITGSWGGALPILERPPVVGGGIFNVRYDDGTLIPGFAVTAPSLTTQPGVERVLYANNQTQRSKFLTAQVYFDSLVTIQKNAFQLYLNNKPFTVSSFFTTVVDGKTVATLQFPYKLLPNASLPEGSYRLVTRAAAVKNLQNQKMTGDFTDSFFRLYGDVNGDGKVDGTDQSVFNTAYGKKAGQTGYLGYLDFDGNGKIDAKDKKAFNARMGRHV